ncbi:MAG: hypothetical protein GW789_14310 [Ignavibacteria bacterium]|nr:hypothetical protein [Ignavibacteria bacterium]
MSIVFEKVKDKDVFAEAVSPSEGREDKTTGANDGIESVTTIFDGRDSFQ